MLCYVKCVICCFIAAACAGNPCGDGGTCSVTRGERRCACRPGFIINAGTNACVGKITVNDIYICVKLYPCIRGAFDHLRNIIG